MTNDQISLRTMLLAVVATIIATVVILEWQGKIKHSDNKAQINIADYKVAMIPVNDSDAQHEVYRLSPKASFQTAFCQQGYLFIANDANPNMQGLLVDYKNRGVKCSSTDMPAQEKTVPAKVAEGPDGE